MSRWIKTVFCALLVGLYGCQGQPDDSSSGGMEKPQVEIASPAAQTEDEAAEHPVSESKGETQFHRVDARMFNSGEDIVILVPDDVDIESGSLIEIKDGPDASTFYFVSVLPR